MDVHTCMVRLRPRFEQVYASQSRSILITGLNGFINKNEEQGLFVHQTRLISDYRYTIGRETPHAVVNSNVEQHSWLGYYIAPPPGGGKSHEDAAQHSIELRLSRYVGEGFHEDVDVTNFTQQPVETALRLVIDADFLDQSDVPNKHTVQGQISKEWRKAGDGRWELVFDFHAEHEYDHQGDKGVARTHRGLTLVIEKASSEPCYDGSAIEFPISLAPHGKWHACISAIAVYEGQPLRLQYGCHSFEGTDNEFDTLRRIYLNEATRFSTAEARALAPAVVKTLEQAKKDIAALRLYDLDQDERAWMPAAGLPIYIALFGRDALTAAWQTGLTSPAVIRGALAVHKERQAAGWDDWHDEQPGKILHQASTGPKGALNYSPLGRYYGELTGPAFYAFVASSLWHWTGDKELVRQFIEPSLKGLRWRDEHADLRRDGFSWYQTRSTNGLKNQGWKDSSDAIVHADGSQAEPPIATVEEQAYEYIAKLRMSELLWWFGEYDGAKRFWHEAGELKKRFNEVFWMEDEGFYGMGLDNKQRLIRSVSSSPGHCLAAGIVDSAHGERTANRLMQDDMYSGWGIRTLSAKHPAYNPYSYHRGSVWPAEHGAFALGLARYGFHGQVQRVARSLFEAAVLLDFNRMPELFTGHPRDADHPFPAFYPRANWPQAWSAGTTFLMIQAMLGLYPYAPLNALMVDPRLPEWLPEITLSNLHVGKAVVEIRFFREASGETDYRVQELQGTLHVIRQPSPWSLTSGPAERIKDAITSFLPGR